MARTLARVGPVLLVAVLASGCSTSTTATTASEGASTSVATPSIDVTAAPSPPAADITTVNGAVPPGEPTAVTKSETLLDAYDDSLEHLVFRDTRPPGTRSPIHEHPYGGTTCVLEGQMTLYLEGWDPQVADPGECYWMPPGLPMAGASTGDVDAVMIDTFAVPPGEPVWWVVEPGMEDIADHNFAPVPHM